MGTDKTRKEEEEERMQEKDSRVLPCVPWSTLFSCIWCVSWLKNEEEGTTKYTKHTKKKTDGCLSLSIPSAWLGCFD